MGRIARASSLHMTAAQKAGIFSALGQAWKESVAHHGFMPTARFFGGNFWEFARESTPAQRRQRYGDADFDWDHRVDTTSGTVGWRDRLLGQFHSAYQPTEPALFAEMMAGLKFDFQQFTFIDIGSGKGRVLLMAADYPFQRILGVELLPSLHRVAEENLRGYRSDSQRCFAVKALCGDAREFAFPAEPILLYLFNPLPEAGMIAVMNNLEMSLRQSPRTVYVLYHNPLLEHVLANYPVFSKVGGTPQYSIFRTSGI